MRAEESANLYSLESPFKVVGAVSALVRLAIGKVDWGLSIDIQRVFRMKQKPARSQWYQPFYDSMQNQIVDLGFTPEGEYPAELKLVTVEDSATAKPSQKKSHAEFAPQFFYRAVDDELVQAIKLYASIARSQFRLSIFAGYSTRLMGILLLQLDSRCPSRYHLVERTNPCSRPGHPGFEITRTDDQVLVAEEAIQRLKTYGLPWLDENTRIENLHRRFNTTFDCSPEGFAYVLSKDLYDEAEVKLEKLKQSRAKNIELFSKQAPELSQEELIALLEKNMRSDQFWKQEYVDKVERACKERSLAVFGIHENKVG